MGGGEGVGGGGRGGGEGGKVRRAGTCLHPSISPDWFHIYLVHRKKKFASFPSRDVTAKLSLGGNNGVITELLLPRGSLVSDIPAGDGKLVNLFLLCRYSTYQNNFFISKFMWLFCFYFISLVFQQARGAVTTHAKEIVFSSVFVGLLLFKSSTTC